MDSQPNNLYDTASQPDTGHDDAYTFLEFNTQGDDDFDYPDFHELSQPNAVRSSPSVWPTPLDSVTVDSVAVDHHSDTNASPNSAKAAGVARGNNININNSNSNINNNFNNNNINNNQASAVDVLAAGMRGLNFEETGDDDGYEYSKGDFMEHACRYCGVQNPACVVRCNLDPWVGWVVSKCIK